MPAPEVELRVKALGIVESRRLRIVAADRATGRVVAHVSGADGEVHRVTCSAGGRWVCSCPASEFGGAPCKHVVAARLVTW